MPWTYWEAVKQNTCFQFTPSVFRGFCWNYVTIPLVTSTCIFLHMKPFSPNSSLVCGNKSHCLWEVASPPHPNFSAIPPPQRSMDSFTPSFHPLHSPQLSWTSRPPTTTNSWRTSVSSIPTAYDLSFKVSLFPCFISYPFVLALLYGSCDKQIYVHGNRLDSYRKLDVFSPSMCCLL